MLLSNRFLVVAAVSLLPAVIIVLTTLFTLQQDSQKTLQQQARQTAEMESLQLERIVSGAEDVLRAASAAPVIKVGKFADCGAVVGEMAAALPFMSSMVIVNPDGIARCQPDPSQPPLSLGDQDYVRQALATDGRIVGGFTTSQTSDRPTLPVAVRIGGQAGAPLGVAVAFINLDWLQKSLAARSFVPGSSVTIADRNGVILARVPDAKKFIGTRVPQQYMHLLTAPAPGTLEVQSQDGTHRLLGYFPLSSTPSGLYVSAGYSTDVGYAPFRTLSLQAGLIALAGIIASLVLALYTGKIFVKGPIETLIGTITSWRDGNTAARTGMAVEQGEICSAGHALDAFMDELVANREARQKAEDQRKLLSEELEHRIKNLLTTIQVIARQTFPKGANDGAMEAFTDRLRALGVANRVLRQENWQSAPLRDLVQASVAPFVGKHLERVSIDGPDLVIGSTVTLGLNMALHELCTNSVKYGALGNEGGTVAIVWSVNGAAGGEVFTLIWTERGGPPVVPPGRTGFGTKVIKVALAAQLSGAVEIAYDPAGVVCRIAAPANVVVAAADDRQTSPVVREQAPRGGVDHENQPSHGDTKMDHSNHTVLDAVDFTADTLTGAVVYGTSDEKIGTVSHVHGMGTASKVVVDVGGFLGIGTKPVVLTTSDLTFMRDEDGEVHATTHLTKDQVKALPEHMDRPA